MMSISRQETDGQKPATTNQPTICPLQPNTKRTRRAIKLPAICPDALKARKTRQEFEINRIEDAWEPWNLVFYEADRTPLSRYAITRRFQNILASAGIEKYRFHDLRHTCATLLLAHGVQLRVVMETLKHSPMAVTADIYSHVLSILMADAADKMNMALTTV